MPLPILPLLGLRTPVSSLTHLVGFFFALHAARRLWLLERRGLGRRLALSCFSVSALLLYAASATYHGLSLPAPELQVLQLLDHSAIYLLIAGTYTPTLALLLKSTPRRNALLATIWAMALGGIACKWLLADPPYWMTVTPYLALGWVGVIEVRQIVRSLNWHGTKWVVAGGVSYSIGAVLDWLRWPTLVPGVFGSHELFHLFVLLGTYCHYVLMVRYVIPYELPPLTRPAPTLISASPEIAI